MPFTDALDQEIDALQASLDADPRMVKIRELRRVRALYERQSGGFIVAQSEPAKEAFDKEGLPPFTNRALPDPMEHWLTFHMNIEKTKRGGRPQSPVRARAVAAAKEFLRDRTTPVPTADIFAHLVAADITLGGTDPKNNLSAMLSNAPEFRSHGRSGWTLAMMEVVK